MPRRSPAYYAQIAAAEGAQVAPGALALIARAADGSVRDGLSLLDRAFALGEEAQVAARSARIRCATCWAWPTAPSCSTSSIC